MNEDFIILIHRFGYTNVGKQPHLSELYKYLLENGYSSEDIILCGEIDQVVRDCFITTSADDLIFKSEAYYRYIEYVELVESRANTKSANRNAVIAIVIASILAVGQIAAAFIA